MIDQLISFETWQLAKLKGFNISICRCGGFPECICNNQLMHTQSLLQKWLREVHNILVFVNHRQYGVSSCNGYYAHIGLSVNNSMEFGQSKTYEECMEIGLYESLKLIKL